MFDGNGLAVLWSPWELCKQSDESLGQRLIPYDQRDKDLMQSCEISSDQISRYFSAKSQKLKMETKSSGREAKEGTHVFQGWAVMYFITGARHFPVSSLDLEDLRYKV